MEGSVESHLSVLTDIISVRTTSVYVLMVMSTIHIYSFVKVFVICL